MGVEVCGYIQVKEQNNGEWELLPLFNDRREHVSLWGCSSLAEALKDKTAAVSRQDKQNLKEDLCGEIDFDEDEDEFKDWKYISLPYLKLLGCKGYKGYSEELSDLARDIESALGFTDIYISSIDEVRYVYFLAY